MQMDYHFIHEVIDEPLCCNGEVDASRDLRSIGCLLRRNLTGSTTVRMIAGGGDWGDVRK